MLSTGEEWDALPAAPLDWTQLEKSGHVQLLDCYRRLIALRHSRSDHTDPRLEHLRIEYDEDAHWIALVRGNLRIACNLGVDPVTAPVGGVPPAVVGRAEGRRNRVGDPAARALVRGARLSALTASHR